ncbi:hypothetical protein [Swingsia samuiensis]|uniref:Uncharacterized protein n=1 Tax=Swingsia samuiensis TaxID=1293412 RepID=A0A4Y6UGS8_9PROT|nr:hypothetical protein [Swingsia samuiensis]QDH16782.1 hypothetical protein E3D00_03765 [Swingsia samuiensis]
MSSLEKIEEVIGSIGRISEVSPVILGNLVLTGIEVPDHMQIGGNQMLAVHRLLGGNKVVDVLGNDPARLELQGRFLGPDAQMRAQMIERMRAAGMPILFSAVGMVFQVWIAQFSYIYEAKGNICSYELILERTSGGLGEEVESGSGNDSILNNISDVVSSFSQGIGDLSDIVFTGSQYIGGFLNQVLPAIQVFGGARDLQKIEQALSKIQVMAQSGVDASMIPSSVSSMGQQMNMLGDGLISLLHFTGQSIEKNEIQSADDLKILAVNASMSNTAMEMAGAVNRVQAMVSQNGGGNSYTPLVYA